VSEEELLIVSEKIQEAYVPGLEWRTGENLLSLPNVMRDV